MARPLLRSLAAAPSSRCVPKNSHIERVITGINVARGSLMEILTAIAVGVALAFAAGFGAGFGVRARISARRRRAARSNLVRNAEHFILPQRPDTDDRSKKGSRPSLGDVDAPDANRRRPVREVG